MSPANNNSSRGMSGVPLDASLRDASPRDESPRDESPVSVARIDRLRNSMPGKDSLVEQLIDLFVSDLPLRLGAIAEAIERADAPALALQAHALRGGAANFGPGRLDQLCAKLEQIGVCGELTDAYVVSDAVRRESVRVCDALLALKSKDIAMLESAPAMARRSRPV